MTALPKISIIVAVYNIEKYIKQCIDSIVNQTFKNLEIICVNDGSTDNSSNVLEDFAKNDERIIVINQKNQGLSEARNTGMKNASGEYIMFVDGDDWIDINMCEEMYQSAIREQADCVMCAYTKEFGTHKVVSHVFDNNYIKWNRDEMLAYFYRRLFGLVDNELKKPEDGDLIVTSCMQLFKKEIALCPFVDTKIIGTEDLLYQVMVYQNCQRFVYIDSPMYHYRKDNSTSLTSTYRQDLADKWNNLYDRLAEIIKKNHLGEIYKTAFYNRVAISIIGIGLNEVNAQNKSFSQRVRTLKKYINSVRYKKSLKQLKTDIMPIHWRAFFRLIRLGMVRTLLIGLYTIEYLRKHKK